MLNGKDFWAWWERVHKNPVVIDREGNVWATRDWDFDKHRPKRNAKPQK